MDRIRLKFWLDEGLSLEQIGELADRHPSTVSYWLRKYGLVPNGREKHSPRGGVDRDQLSALVAQGWTIRAIAAELGVSATTVRHWISRYDLPRPVRVRQDELDRVLEEGLQTVQRVCRRHGLTDFAVIGRERRLRCKRCRSEVVVQRRRRIKQILVEEAGGRCELCGYDLCPRALEFHHREPSSKAFGLARAGITRSLEAARAEVAKCALLCANCHAEVEAGVTKLPLHS